MIEKKNFYINGKWVSPSKPNDFEVIDPSTEEPFAVISLGSAKYLNIIEEILTNGTGATKKREFFKKSGGGRGGQ